MRYAITADLHLSTKQNHPERLDALSSILSTCAQSGIETLFIAGDLFDQSVSNPSDFENTIKAGAPKNLKVIILRGNHDMGLRQAAFTLPAIQVIEQPTVLKLEDNGLPIVLLPYQTENEVGKQLALLDGIKPDNFILISHGDWLGGKQIRNAYEQGTYMPLRSSDLQKFKPSQVFLGHIHIPYKDGIVWYCGSPCALDITETGKRSFILFDDRSGVVERVEIPGSKVNLIEKVTIYPAEDELSIFTRHFEKTTADQNLQGQESRIRARMILQGVTTDRKKIVDDVHSYLSSKGVEIESIKHDGLQIEVNPAKRIIADRAIDTIQKTYYSESEEYPEREDILALALQIIYGGEQ